MTKETAMILEQLQAMNRKVDALSEGMAGLKSDVSELKADVGTLKSDVTELKADVGTLKSDVNELKADVSGLKNETSLLRKNDERQEQQLNGIQITLETIIKRDIQIIAEGHLDLSRKLTEALKVEDSREMLRIQVNRMAYDISEIKERIG